MQINKRVPNTFFSFVDYSIRNLLFPRDIYCAVCNSELYLNEHNICELCNNILTYSDENSEIAIKYIRSTKYALVYDKAIRSTIHRYKYDKNAWIANFFADLMLDTQNYSEYILVPVPMHKNRRRLRNFCHTTELAKQISKVHNLEVENKALFRNRDTLSQTQLNHEERKTNIVDAFSANERIVAGNKFLLIDDVITTGSTLSQCAKTLRKAGAADVLAWAVAH